MAIEENPFQTEQFVWIDFGIFHMIRDELYFAVALKNLVRKHYKQVRIGSCVDLYYPCTKDVFREVLWYFAGSIFGGGKVQLLEFADTMKDFTTQLILEKHHIMWEINIWYILFHSNPQLFSCYRCNHNLSILENY